MKLAIILALVSTVAAAQSAPFPSTPTTAAYKTMAFTLQPGGSSSPIKVPAVNRPIHMMIAVNTSNSTGVGEATIVRTKPASVLRWIGIDYATNAGGTAAVSQGSANNLGRHIIYADDTGLVDIQVANAEAVLIHNFSGSVQTGVLTFVW